MSYMPNIVTLVGGFCCELTCEQQNKWTEFVGTDPRFLERYLANAKIEYLHSCAKGGKFNAKECENLINRLFELDDELFKLAKAWYGTLNAGLK